MIFPLLWKCLERSWVYRLHHRLVSPDTFWARYATDFLKAKPGERVLDIGCGTADILDHLDRVDYTGIDYNPDYIAAARARYGNRGMFICAAVTPELAGIYQGFDLVIATGLLHHLNDVEADALFATARAALRPGGRFITLDGVFIQNQNPIERWLVSRDRGRHVRSDEAYIALARRHFPRATGRVLRGVTRIPWTHYLMDCPAEADAVPQ